MNNEITSGAEAQEKSIILNAETINFLDTARKWSMFIAILGFIGLAMALLVSAGVIIIISFIPNETIPFGIGILLSFVYLVIAVLYFFPVLYLYRFSDMAGKAAKSLDSLDLQKAILNLKSHYKFLGIMIISVFALYPVIIVVAIVTGVMSSL